MNETHLVTRLWNAIENGTVFEGKDEELVEAISALNGEPEGFVLHFSTGEKYHVLVVKQ